MVIVEKWTKLILRLANVNLRNICLKVNVFVNVHIFLLWRLKFNIIWYRLFFSQFQLWKIQNMISNLEYPFKLFHDLMILFIWADIVSELLKISHQLFDKEI